MQYVLLKDNIRKLPLSIRILNVLNRNGVHTIGDMIQSRESLKNFRYIGKKGIEEIEQWIDSLDTGTRGYSIIENEYKTDVIASLEKEKILQDTDKDLIQELIKAYKLQPEICSEFIFKTRLNFPDANGKTFIYHLYEIDTLYKILHEKLLSIFEENEEGMSLENLMKKIPKHLRNTTIIEEALLSMEKKNELRVEDDIYIRVYPSIMDYFKTVDDEKKRQILLDRFNGKTLQEVGDTHGVTKERVRQICKKELYKAHKVMQSIGRHFHEDKYLYVFSKYEISKEDFTLAFKEPLSAYEYLRLTVLEDPQLIPPKPFEEALEDDEIPVLMRKQIERAIYKNYVVINGQRIHKDRPSLVDYYVKNYCRELTKYDDFEQGYHNFLNGLDMPDKKNFEINKRTYENRLNDHICVLWNQWRRFRYYDIRSRDYEDFLKNINLMQYDGLEISTLKIFRENPSLMEEYDIHDEYELHNLLKKIWDKSDTKVNFKRMPTIEIGTTDRDAQIWSLLLQYTPVSTERLGALYEELYGAKASTVIGGYLKSFDKYLFDGIYSVNVQDLQENEYAALDKILTEDYYTMQDIKEIYLREFPGSDIECINSYTLKNLGFHVYSGYVIRNTYATATDYFDSLIIKDDVLDTRECPENIQNLGAYNNEIRRLRHEREIVEFGDCQYINIRKLNQLGITKDTMEDYCRAVSCFVEKDAFFTIHSIMADGFSHELDKLGFDEIFYSAVLIEDRERFSYQNVGKTRVFVNGISKNITAEMLKSIIRKNGKFDIYALQKLLENHYGIFLDKNKLISIIRSTDMYYDAITEAVYINFNKYFEEI